MDLTPAPAGKVLDTLLFFRSGIANTTEDEAQGLLTVIHYETPHTITAPTKDRCQVEPSRCQRALKAFFAHM